MRRKVTQLRCRQRAVHTLFEHLNWGWRISLSKLPVWEALCPAGTNFSSGKILSRRPTIIRGLYLSKEPLEYQKSSTRFRFSFQKPDEEICPDGKPKLLRKRLIFPRVWQRGFAICKQDQWCKGSVACSMFRRVTAMSLGVGTQLLGNIVKLMRHKVKWKIICILALLTIPKRIQIMRESSQRNNRITE